MSQYVPIELDKVRNLKIGIKASKIVQDETGKPLVEIIGSFENEMNIDYMIWILYAGLVHEDNKLTFDKVLDIVDEHSNIDYIFEKIGKAIEVSFNKGKPSDAAGLGKSKK